MPRLRRQAMTGCALGAVLLLATGCGQALAGTALPNGDEAATYVGGKFKTAMDKLESSITGPRNISSSLDLELKVDDKVFGSKIEASRAGSPESRTTHDQSPRKPEETIQSYFPAAGTVQYLYLGPAFKSLEPTSWVATPKPATGLINGCSWSGTGTPCRMADAVVDATQKDPKTIKGAKSMANGSIELTVDVPFGTSLDDQVVLLPSSGLGEISDSMKKVPISTKIVLKPDSSLDSFSMDANFAADNHKIELHYDFKFTGSATVQDMPKLPDPSQITVLDQAGADELDRQLDNFSDGGH